MNNYFENALKNYIESLPNEKEAYYMDTNTVNFKTLIDFLFTDKVFCNKIDEDIGSFVVELGNNYDEETGESSEIFQYFIVDYDPWRMEVYKAYLRNHEEESSFILLYDTKLELYILGITHFGTSWDCVPTSIEIKRGVKNGI